MQPERPRARRYPFAANIELIDLESEAEAKDQTTDLSLFGCHVRTLKNWAPGTRVRMRIAYRGAVFAALGRVANVRTNVGVGVVFTQIEQKDQLILEKWVAELRDEGERPSQGD